MQLCVFQQFNLNSSTTIKVTAPYYTFYSCPLGVGKWMGIIKFDDLANLDLSHIAPSLLGKSPSSLVVYGLGGVVSLIYFKGKLHELIKAPLVLSVKFI